LKVWLHANTHGVQYLMGFHLRHFIYNIDSCCKFLKIYIYLYGLMDFATTPKNMYVCNSPKLFIKAFQVPMFYTNNFHEFHHMELNGQEGASWGTFNYKSKLHMSPYIGCWNFIITHKNSNDSTQKFTSIHLAFKCRSHVPSNYIKLPINAL
jgi:hypothetical protein